MAKLLIVIFAATAVVVASYAVKNFSAGSDNGGGLALVAALPLSDDSASGSAPESAVVSDFVPSPSSTSSAPPYEDPPASPTPASCRFEGSGKVVPKTAWINEIAWMGSAGDPQAEWIELANLSGTAVVLSGWSLMNRDGSVNIKLQESDIVLGSGFFLLERGSDASASGAPADRIYSGALSNKGEDVRLLDSECALVDEVIALSGWPAGDNDSKTTMERNLTVSGWHSSRISGGTPRALNTTPAPSPTPVISPAVQATYFATPTAAPTVSPSPSFMPSSAPTPTPFVSPTPTPASTPMPTPPVNGGQGASNASHVLISEIFIDMEGADAGEFVELWNPGSAPVDLSAWSLQYLSGSASSFGSVAKKNFSAGAAIAPGGFYLIGTGGYSGAVPADMTWSQALNNTAATIFLVASQSPLINSESPDIVDRVGYGNGAGTFAPESASAPLPPENQSIERKAWQNGCVSAQWSGQLLGNGCDADNNSSDFEINAAPNPQNSQSQKEP